MAETTPTNGDTDESGNQTEQKTRQYRVPMKMVKTAEVIVGAEDEDAAAELMDPPTSPEAEQALQDADWTFRGYETDFTWGIEEAENGE